MTAHLQQFISSKLNSSPPLLRFPIMYRRWHAPRGITENLKLITSGGTALTGRVPLKLKQHCDLWRPVMSVERWSNCAPISSAPRGDTTGSLGEGREVLNEKEVGLLQSQPTRRKLATLVCWWEGRNSANCWVQAEGWSERKNKEKDGRWWWSPLKFWIVCFSVFQLFAHF